MGNEVKYCANCKKPLTERQASNGNKHCSRACSNMATKRKDPVTLKGKRECARKRVRYVIKNNFSVEERTRCWNCGFNIVQICHIKPRKDFSINASYEEINAVDNLLILCPNCHAQFDRGIITKDEILEKKKEVFRKKDEVSDQARFVLSEPKDSFRISEEEWISGIQIPTEVSSAAMVGSTRLLPISLQAFV